MSLFKLSIAAAVGLSLIGAAHAQSTENPLAGLSKGLWTRPDYDKIYQADRMEEAARRELMTLHKAATAALDARDYAAAEKTAADMLSRDPTTRDAHFLMGLAKTGLEKWEEARTHLEAAVKAEPTRPEPKARLGLIYLKLDNPDSAKLQRAELVSLETACKGVCTDAAWISSGILTLDQAMAGPVETVPQAPAASYSATVTAALASTPDFTPEKYSLATFSDMGDLYEVLTRDGRCAPKKLADPRQPCALILYERDDGAKGGLTKNFKPVFRVDSRKSVWAIHDKELQKVRIEDLYFDIEQIIGQKATTYRSVAVIGNAENKTNCASGLPCLSHLVTEDMFRMYNNMPDSVVDVIWGAGMQQDSRTVRIR